MKKSSLAFFLISTQMASPLFAAGLDELSKKPAVKTNAAESSSPQKAEPKPTIEKPATPTPAKPPVPAKPKVEPEAAEEEEAEAAPTTEKAEIKPVVRSAASKALDNRLSIGTSLGWSIVKPAKGTWIGIGAADSYFRWRAASAEDGPLYITGRYAPIAGVWSTGSRDYDTTLHGIFGGAEYILPIRVGANLSIKGSAELGYMLVYAKAQDGAPEASDVKKGTVNLSVGTGADWSLFSNKLKVGPFVRLHAVGFSMVNIGGSAQFVF